MLLSIFIFLLFTVIFFIVINYKTEVSKCSGLGDKCYDGNGRYQYKGRGYKKESVEVLLSRIDWLAKNSTNTTLYSTAYIIAFPITLAVIVILFAFTSYIISPWEIVLILFSSFIISFSILNLFYFHTDRYPNYYIRKNIDYIRRQLSLEKTEPPKPSPYSKTPFRTKIQDVLTK